MKCASKEHTEHLKKDQSVIWVTGQYCVDATLKQENILKDYKILTSKCATK